jgi:hypothetical protein
MVVGWPAMNATIEGSRIPGDFKFDPLGLGKKDFARMQVPKKFSIFWSAVAVSDYSV